MAFRLWILRLALLDPNSKLTFDIPLGVLKSLAGKQSSRPLVLEPPGNVTSIFNFLSKEQKDEF